jgi:hypothetical protein
MDQFVREVLLIGFMDGALVLDLEAGVKSVGNRRFLWCP